MTDSREAEIRERLEKITPGPWAHKAGVLRRDVPETPESEYYGDNVLLHANLPGARAFVFKRGDAEFIANSPSDITYLLSLVAELREERDKAVKAREHTWDWIKRHYGKLEDWARKVLPEPWRNQFFSCVANGLYDATEDRGEPYMSVGAGMIHPGGYFKMETAQEQLLYDHMTRAESAEQRNTRLTEALKEALSD